MGRIKTGKTSARQDKLNPIPVIFQVAGTHVGQSSCLLIWLFAAEANRAAYGRANMIVRHLTGRGEEEVMQTLVAQST